MSDFCFNLNRVSCFVTPCFAFPVLSQPEKFYLMATLDFVLNKSDNLLRSVFISKSKK